MEINRLVSDRESLLVVDCSIFMGALFRLQSILTLIL